jgi:hypothetical protein
MCLRRRRYLPATVCISPMGRLAFLKGRGASPTILHHMLRLDETSDSCARTQPV